jgi:hypothetical protein
MVQKGRTTVNNWTKRDGFPRNIKNKNGILVQNFLEWLHQYDYQEFQNFAMFYYNALNV